MLSAGHHFRRATAADAELLCDMTRELARYEGLLPLVNATPERLAEVLSSPQPKAFYEVMEVRGEPAGFAACFESYSTFEGRHGLFVEDIFVREPWRRRGLAREMFTHLAAHCLREGLTRLEWRVLAWNDPAIGFFASLQAPVNDEWRFGRMTQADMVRLAAQRSLP
jgi:diamine N-acetyltransferase